MTDLAPFFAIGMLLVRPGALILSAPILGGAYVPAQVKIALTVFVALMLLPTTAVPAVPSAMGMTFVVAREVAIGVAFGLAIRIVVSSAEFAGHMAASQMGLAYSATVDPASGARHTSMATLYGNLAMITFLGVNAHHIFLRALGDSYTRLPIGVGQIDASMPSMVMGLLGLTFTFALRIAAPFVVTLLVVELGMALVTRTAPALHMMTLGAPIRVLIGLLILGAAAPEALRVLATMSTGAVEAGARAAEAFR